MKIQMPEPTIHHYSEVNPGLIPNARHYELNQVVNGSPVFTEFIKISQDGKSTKSKPYFWLEIREDKKWKTPAVIGLFKTNFPGIFNKNSQHKKNLIIVKFGNDASQVTIYYFKDFYSRDLKALLGSTIS